MRDLIERYDTDVRAVERFYDLTLSDACAERARAFEEEWLARLGEVAYDALNRDGRVDYHLMASHIRHKVCRITRRKGLAEQEHEFLPFARVIVQLEEDRRALKPLDARAASEHLSGIARGAEDAWKRLTRKPGEGEEPASLSPELARRGHRAVEGLTGTLEAWFGHYADYKPGLSWWLQQPYDAAHKALTTLGKVLKKRSEPEGAIVGEPIGRQALEEDLEHEMIAYTIEELIGIGERELAWCEGELRKAARELGHGDDWHAALEAVKGRHVPPGEQDELIAEQVREAIAYVEEHDLVTVEPLCRELWRLDMLSEDSQKTLPYQAYGGQKVLVSFPTRGMAIEARHASMRANNVHFSRAVTQHEMIPGHHLQIYMGERYRRYRRPFGTPFLGEGWCLYWEMLLWDRGFARGPEDRVGMLFWRAHRCARIIISLRFHCGEMTTAEMVDFLIECVGHERDAATSEVRRYVSGDYAPVSQCAYMIGGLQVRALYRELVESSRMTAREFHDAVLRENSMPIELIRAALLGQTLEREWQPSWRFAD
jgi:uncharacterized protein (DUF885 family)